MSLLAHLEARFGDDVSEASFEGSELRATVKLARLGELLRLCRHEEEFDFDYPSALTAYDTGDDFVLVYRLTSLTHKHTALLQARVPRSDPKAPTALHLWKGVEWYEREAFDMFGIVFEGHPDMRRILLPDDWQGHPFRKDYVSVPSGTPLGGPQPVDPVGGAQ